MEKRNEQAKNALNSKWRTLKDKQEINLAVNWKVYPTVCRVIQSYAVQVWEFTVFKEVNKLQRYFVKKILKLPSFTPN